MAHATLAEVRVAAVAPGGDDEGRQAALEEGVGVVEAGTVDGRGPAGVLRGAEDDDGVGGLRLVARRLFLDAGVEEGNVAERERKNRNEQAGPPASLIVRRKPHERHPDR